jgi:hypothetical protein
MPQQPRPLKSLWTRRGPPMQALASDPAPPWSVGRTTFAGHFDCAGGGGGGGGDAASWRWSQRQQLGWVPGAPGMRSSGLGGSGVGVGCCVNREAPLPPLPLVTPVAATAEKRLAPTSRAAAASPADRIAAAGLVPVLASCRLEFGWPAAAAGPRTRIPP